MDNFNRIPQYLKIENFHGIYVVDKIDLSTFGMGIMKIERSKPCWFPVQGDFKRKTIQQNQNFHQKNSNQKTLKENGIIDLSVQKKGHVNPKK